MTRQRLDPAVRRPLILSSTCGLAAQGPTTYDQLTREQVAGVAQVSPATIQYYWATMDAFRSAVMAYAIENRLVPVVAQGLAARDPLAVEAPANIKQEAAAYLVK